MPFPLRFTSPFLTCTMQWYLLVYIYIYVHSTLHSERQPSSCSYVGCPSAHCTWRVISAVQEREKPIAWPPWLRSSSSSQDCSPWRVEISYGFPEAILKLGFEMWCKFGWATIPKAANADHGNQNSGHSTTFNVYQFFQVPVLQHCCPPNGPPVETKCSSESCY